MMHRTVSFLLLFVSSVCLVQPRAKANEAKSPQEATEGEAQLKFKIAGTDLLAEVLTPTLNRYATENNIDLELELFGSMPALEALKSGTADLGLIAIPDDEAKTLPDYKLIPFAYQVAVVIVKDVNPISEISFPQLAGIYGISSEVNYTRWNEIGLTGVWNNRPIQALTLSKEGSVAFELFKYKVLEQVPIKSTVITANTLTELLDLISGDGGAIAVVDQFPEASGFKTLSVSRGIDGDFAFGPTPESVYYGDYAMRLPIYLVYKEENVEKIKPLLHLFLGEGVAKVINGHGLMALPENVRRRTILELDIQR